jgi:hypothetical protein
VPVERQVHEPATATINQHRPGQKHDPSPCVHATHRFHSCPRKDRRLPTGELSAGSSQGAGQAGRFEPGGGRFKRAYYINPETQFDKGNEWVEYFESVFMK